MSQNPRAAQIELDPSGLLVVTSTDVQGAIAELDAATGGGSSALTVQDENSNVSTSVTQLDLQGAGVTATSGTGEVVVTIPGYTDEQARDALGAALVAGANITITPNDGADTITISSSGGYTDEQARDAIAAALVAGTGVTITVNDGADTITIDATGGGGGGSSSVGATEYLFNNAI